MLKHSMIYGSLLLMYASMSYALDSSQITAPQTTPQAVTRVSPRPAIVNGNFNALLVCPDTPNCANINGVYSQPNQPANCPDTCIKTRSVTPASGVPITAYTPAICPPGYSQITAYNMQQEIIYLPNANIIRNIPTLAELNGYRNYGYMCRLVRIGGSGNFCDNADAAHNPWFAQTPTNVDTIISTGYAGQNTVDNNGVAYMASPPGCKNLCGSVGQVPCTPVSYYNTYWYITWYQYECLPPSSNLIYTGNVAPASVVCERTNNLEWRQGN